MKAKAKFWLWRTSIARAYDVSSYVLIKNKQSHSAKKKTHKGQNSGKVSSHQWIKFAAFVKFSSLLFTLQVATGIRWFRDDETH